jgi:putative addiction module component (TIGR02574 family)
MPMTKEQLLDEAKALDPRQRAELIEDLRQITDDELTPELRAELRRRVAAIDRGEVAFIPGEQVMREIRERLSRQ